MAHNAAIVVAAGAGTRFGAPKQFLTLGSTRLVDRAVARAAEACDAVILVLPAGQHWDGPPVTATVTGGATRAVVRSRFGGIGRVHDHDGYSCAAVPDVPAG